MSAVDSIPKGTPVGTRTSPRMDPRPCTGTKKASASENPGSRITDAVQRVLSEKGAKAKLRLADLVLEIIRRAKKAGIEIADVDDLKTVEDIRSSLWPQPVAIDHRTLGLSVNLSGGLSDEALAEIERLAKIM